MSQPYVTADNAAVANPRVSAENSRVRVYDDVISNIWVPFYALDGISVSVKLKALNIGNFSAED